jgi:DNA-binding NarL/FixJ family response regulator
MKIRADIPVIICSGYSDEDLVNRASQIGINAFLMKPLVIRDLANAIREVLGKANSTGTLSAAN